MPGEASEGRNNLKNMQTEENEEKKKKKMKNEKAKERRQEPLSEAEGKTTQSEVEAKAKNSISSKKRKQVFPFGNYRNYYGYRIGQDVEEDPRLRVLKKEWFHGRDCLDIGCNSGVVTIQIAKKYHCRSMLGIDIDSSLIEHANWHLRKIMRTRTESANNKSAETPVVKDLEKLNGSRHSVRGRDEEVTNELPRDCASSGEIDLSNIVSFRKENIVLSHHPSDKKYDTILCLSVTKWIHLNWGDDGLITLFSKIWRLLRPGGVFVLEPQPWGSYEKNRKVSEVASVNYYYIMFRPEYFREILLDKIGFRSVEDVTSGLSGTKTGFERPVFVYYK